MLTAADVPLTAGEMPMRRARRHGVMSSVMASAQREHLPPLHSHGTAAPTGLNASGKACWRFTHETQSCADGRCSVGECSRCPLPQHHPRRRRQCPPATDCINPPLNLAYSQAVFTLPETSDRKSKECKTGGRGEMNVGESGGGRKWNTGGNRETGGPARGHLIHCE